MRGRSRGPTAIVDRIVLGRPLCPLRSSSALRPRRGGAPLRLASLRLTPLRLTPLRLTPLAALAGALLAVAACGGGEPEPHDHVLLETTVLRLLDEPGALTGAPGSAAAEAPVWRTVVPAVQRTHALSEALVTRKALPARPGDRFEFRFEVPPSAVLDFELSLDRSAVEADSQGLVIEVSIDGETIWSRGLSAETRTWRKAWLPVRLDLEAWEGRTVSLGFAAHAKPGASPSAGDLAGIAGPVVVRVERTPRGRSGPAQPNLLLLLVDTLRADALELGGETATPCIAGLAAEGFVFRSAFSAAPWTMPSVASIFTGMHVRVHGTTGEYQPRLLERHETLAERLGALGIASHAFVANPLISAEQSFDQGFGGFTQGLPEGRSDGLFREAADWIEAQGEGRWFAYVHAMDPHDPYEPPAAELERLRAAYSGPYPEADTATLKALRARHQSEGDSGASAADVAHFRALYDAEVAAFDASLAAMLARLEASGALANTLVVITSDHGEEFGEHGGFLHGHDLFDELVHVPLIFWGPGLVELGATDAPVSLVDLAPTLCRLLGAGAEAGPSLFEVARGAPGSPLLFTTQLGTRADGLDGLRDARAKIKRWADPVRYELYDLEADAGEQVDLMRGVELDELEGGDARRARIDELLAALDRLRAEAEERGPVDPGEAPDPQALEAMRSLGYVE